MHTIFCIYVLFITKFLRIWMRIIWPIEWGERGYIPLTEVAYANILSDFHWLKFFELTVDLFDIDFPFISLLSLLIITDLSVK